VAFIGRYGEALVPTESSVIQEGDRLHVASAVADVEAVVAHMQRGPEVQ